MRRKKSYIEEYVFNANMIKKLYNMYIHQTFWEKFLDFLVFLAITFTAVSFVLQFLVGVDQKILLVIHSASLFILAIFGLELLKEYAKSNKKGEFLTRHWLDLTLVSILSFFFLFGGFLGYLNLKELSLVKDLTHETKGGRAIYKLFRR